MRSVLILVNQSPTCKLRMEAISTFSNEVSYQIAVIIGSYLFLEAISCFWKENEVSLAKNVLLFTIGIIGCFLFYQALGSLLCLLLYAIIPSFSNGVSYHSAITTIRIIIIESSAVWFKEKRAQDTKTMAFIVTASLPMKVCASCSKKQMKDSFSKKTVEFEISREVQRMHRNQKSGAIFEY